MKIKKNELTELNKKDSNKHIIHLPVKILWWVEKT